MVRASQRRVLRRARREAALRPPSRLAYAAAVLAYLAAVTPLGLTVGRVIVGSPVNPALLVLAGTLVSAQSLAQVRANGSSIRLNRTAVNVLEAVLVAVFAGLAAGPLGGWLSTLWLDHPAAWHDAGVLTVLGVLAVLTAHTIGFFAVGPARFLGSAIAQLVEGAINTIVRLLVGRGEFVVLTVGVFRPDRRLFPAALALAAVLALRTAYRLRPSRPAMATPARDMFVLTRLPPDDRHRQLRSWVYDQFIAGRPDDRLAQAALRIAYHLTPEVTRTSPPRTPVDLPRAAALLGLADEVIEIMEEEGLPRLTGVDRIRILRRLEIARSMAAEVRARIAVASGDRAQGVELLRQGADRLRSADLHQLAAFQEVLAAYCAADGDDLDATVIDELDRLVDEGAVGRSHGGEKQEAVSMAVRRPAARLLAAQRYRQGEEEQARELWLAARHVPVGYADYRIVADEYRVEAGGRPLPFAAVRLGRARIRERLLFARSEDLLAEPLVRDLWIETLRTFGAPR
ncbi:hypothetical protein [Actinoallomurus sp. NPDC050550]|uniref:hypothetical protein n=1 Tax=Actinoallomurus sp. NPDC050550 TaxID=3154937 RepID=UPI0033CB6097